MKNFNEAFRKDVIYDNIKSHKKPRLYPLSRRCIFGKATGGRYPLKKEPLMVKKENKIASIVHIYCCIYIVHIYCSSPQSYCLR